MITKEKLAEFVTVLMEGLQWPGSNGVLVTLDDKKTICMDIIWDDPTKQPEDSVPTSLEEPEEEHA